MNTTKILLTSQDFIKQFKKCCNSYTSLKIAVAWCGNPAHVYPYNLLETYKGKMEVLLGTSFYHTHPDSFNWFKKINAKVRVFYDNQLLFHPKIYLFTKGNEFALFLGSSNFTEGGFFSNVEANVLITGISSDEKTIKEIKTKINLWNQNEFSFNPNRKWITEYKKKYLKCRKKERDAGLYSARQKEEEFGSTSWLRNDEWSNYYKRLKSAIIENDYHIDGLLNLFKMSSKLLKIPWEISYFKDIERRKIMGGRVPYAELGHVVSSGWLAGLLASGPLKDWQIIIEAINNIARMNIPLDYLKLELELRKLVKLGFTMKTWGRFLSLIRPDLYCTVSSNNVREKLADTLQTPKSLFTKPEGYIKLIKMLHTSQWFNSPKPKNKEEAIYWKNRVALMDVIFYS